MFPQALPPHGSATRRGVHERLLGRRREDRADLALQYTDAKRSQPVLEVFRCKAEINQETDGDKEGYRFGKHVHLSGRDVNLRNAFLMRQVIADILNEFNQVPLAVNCSTEFSAYVP